MSSYQKMPEKIKVYSQIHNGEFKTDWKSIMISNIVAFLGAVTMSSITPTVWPYMKKIDVNTTETLYGFIRGLFALGNIIFSMLSGYLSNLISDTKPAMIIGKSITIFAALAYLMVEIFPLYLSHLFIAFELLVGASVGICSVFRTHIAMASTEKDRSRAFGLTQLATSVGLIVGPLLQVIFSKIKYPGIPLLAGSHFNLYTAPVIVLALTSIFGIILLFFCFDGKMRVHKLPAPIYTEDVMLGTFDEDTFLEEKIISENNKKINKTTKKSFSAAKEAPKYDLIAVIVLILVKLSIETVFLNLVTVLPPYAMTAFQWSPEEAIIFQSAVGAIIGAIAISFSLLYVFFKLGNKVKERTTLAFTILLFLSFHLITYPWEIYPEKIHYQHVKGTTPPANLTMAMNPELRNIVAESKIPGSNIQIVGCNPAFEWCETTPKVNIYIFYGCAIVTVGIGWPLVHINLDILYSKVLGPIKQGTLQGIFVATAQILNVIGPLAFSKLYTLYGPKIIWGFEIVICSLTLAVFLFFFNRMISWSERPDVAGIHTLPMEIVEKKKKTKTTKK